MPEWNIQYRVWDQAPTTVLKRRSLAGSLWAETQLNVCSWDLGASDRIQGACVSAILDAYENKDADGEGSCCVGQPPTPDAVHLHVLHMQTPERHKEVVDVTLPTQTPEWREETRLLRLTERKSQSLSSNSMALDQGSGNFPCRLCLAHLLFLNSWWLRIVVTLLDGSEEWKEYFMTILVYIFSMTSFVLS